VVALVHGSLAERFSVTRPLARSLLVMPTSTDIHCTTGNWNSHAEQGESGARNFRVNLSVIRYHQ
jgi:hypothetical protein